MSRHVEESLLAAADALRRLAYKVPEAEAIAATRAAEVDGWPPARETTARRGISELTPVEAAAQARLRHEREVPSLHAMLRQAEAIISNAERMCDRIAGYQIQVPLCTGGVGLDGAFEVEDAWGDPVCDRLPEAGRHLCSKHRKRRDRWRRRHSLPAQDQEPAA